MELAGPRAFVCPAGATTSWETRFASLRQEGRGFNIRLLDLRMRAVSEVTLSGGTACLERPPAKLRACGLPGDDQGLPKDFMVNLFAATGTVAAAVIAFVQAGIAQRDSERAQRDSERARRESNEGRTQAAADRMMEPFAPQKKKAEVVPRGIMKTISERIQDWDEHATIIAGRFGAGKSVAVEEVLRDMKGVYVHTVWDKDWASSLYHDLGLDNLGMLQDALRLVKERNQGSTPILVLEIPRTAKEGAVSATLVVLCLIRLGAGMDTVSTFAKILSSDSSLAHAGTRRLSRPVSLCCGRVLCKLSAGFLPR